MTRLARWLPALFVPVVAWIVARLQFAEPLTWDEFEFFRATRWIGLGDVPYRDFWEHHTPLQWFLFAPVARLFGGGAGAESILVLRWAQLPLWIGAFALLLFFGRRAGISWPSRALAALFLLTSKVFVNAALQYRLDTVGNLAFLAGLALLVTRRWIAFGAVMAAAVLANMRLAPLAIAAALLALCFDEERWRWNPRALRLLLGVAAVALAFVAYLFATGAWPAFVEGVIDYNVTSNRLAEAGGEGALLPLLNMVIRDVGALALIVAAAAGIAFALRDWRRPSVLTLLAVLTLLSLALVAATAVQYDYHLQNAFLLMVPLAALALERFARLQPVAVATAAIAIVMNVAALLTPSLGNELAYQDAVMETVDRMTRPGDKVWDGSGYALRREPAYRYWFLAAGVRLLAQQRLIEPYNIQKDPPAAIVYNYRVHRWLLAFPRTGEYAVRHYVPLYRNLWIPGMNTLVEGRQRTEWIAPASGRYAVWASNILAKHPWIARPLEYGRIEGPDATLMRIPLEQLPPLPAEQFVFAVDGVAQPRGTRSLTLRKGARVTMFSNTPARAGVLLVPHGVRTLCVAPEEYFVF